jgi:hypothetical protein
MIMDLECKLREWDGVHIEYLTRIYAAHYLDLIFFHTLISICINDQSLQKPTTWLIKHHYDNGHTLPCDLTEKLLTTCKNIENWEAKLHLLQLLPYIKLTEKSIIITEDFTRKCLKDNNKFVRAWAYNGIYELTKYIPELNNELESICKIAMETESASVKSKVRKIQKLLNKRPYS